MSNKKGWIFMVDNIFKLHITWKHLNKNRGKMLLRWLCAHVVCAVFMVIIFDFFFISVFCGWNSLFLSENRFPLHKIQMLCWNSRKKSDQLQISVSVAHKIVIENGERANCVAVFHSLVRQKVRWTCKNACFFLFSAINFYVELLLEAILFCFALW